MLDVGKMQREREIKSVVIWYRETLTGGMSNFPHEHFGAMHRPRSIHILP